MSGHKWFTFLSEAILCSLGFMAFAFFIHYEFPYRLVSFAALSLPAYIAAKNLKSLSDIKKITGESGLNKSVLVFCLSGVVLSVLLAVMYRYHLGICLFPHTINWFVLAAALIGCTEELVFRGFIQDLVNNINSPVSIIFSTLSHTSYKCFLFLSPAITTDINIGYLALWTIIAGVLFGIIKHYSKSILPSLIAHGLFDILVYAEFSAAPWWVW
jgi:membrane protease YdiL (CAAX protease family)